MLTSDNHTPKESMLAPATEQSQEDICPACGFYSSVCGSCWKESPGKVQSTASRIDPAENGVTEKYTSNKKLMIVIGNQQFECKSGDVLGRTGTVACQIFSGITTVSGRHVSVQIDSGEWSLTNLPLQPGKLTKNITAVNGRELPIGDSVRLSEVTTLQMSSKCTVTLRVV